MTNQAESSTSGNSAEERSSALREALDSLREDFKSLRSDLGASGKEALRSLGDEVKEKSGVALDASRECIRKNPILCVGATLGIGIIIGRMLIRR